MKALSAAEAARWLRAEGSPAHAPISQPILLDVREPWELEIAQLPGCTHIPMGQIPARFHELAPLTPIICLCHHGVRSARVALFLEHQGFESVYNLTGGIDAWSAEVDPSLPTY